MRKTANPYGYGAPYVMGHPEIIESFKKPTTPSKANTQPVNNTNRIPFTETPAYKRRLAEATALRHINRSNANASKLKVPREAAERMNKSISAQKTNMNKFLADRNANPYQHIVDQHNEAVRQYYGDYMSSNPADTINAVKSIHHGIAEVSSGITNAVVKGSPDIYSNGARGINNSMLDDALNTDNVLNYNNGAYHDATIKMLNDPNVPNDLKMRIAESYRDIDRKHDLYMAKQINNNPGINTNTLYKNKDNRQGYIQDWNHANGVINVYDRHAEPQKEVGDNITNDTRNYHYNNGSVLPAATAEGLHYLGREIPMALATQPLWNMANMPGTFVDDVLTTAGRTTPFLKKLNQVRKIHKNVVNVANAIDAASFVGTGKSPNISPWVGDFSYLYPQNILYSRYVSPNKDADTGRHVVEKARFGTK